MRECEDDNNNNTQNIVSQSVYQSVRLSVRQHAHMRCFVSLLSRSESAISSTISSAQFPTFPSNVPFPQSLSSLSRVSLLLTCCCLTLCWRLLCAVGCATATRWTAVTILGFFLGAKLRIWRNVLRVEANVSIRFSIRFSPCLAVSTHQSLFWTPGYLFWTRGFPF
jgi:hypothetical protein